MPRPSIARAFTLAFTAVAAVIATIASLAIWQVTALQSAQGWVRHTYQVLAAITDLDFAISTAESGERAYLFTGDAGTLAPYQAAIGRLPLLQGDLQRLTHDNPTQQRYVLALAPLVEHKVDSSAQLIALRRDRGPEAALNALRTGLPQRLSQSIQATLSAMLGEEQRLLAKRLRSAKHSAVLARLFSIATAVAALLLLAWAARILSLANAAAQGTAAEQHALAERLQTSLDSLSQGVGVFTADRRLAHWNACFQILLDLPKAMVRRDTAYAAFAEHTQARSDAALLETEEQIVHGPSGRTPGEPIVYERTRAGDGHVLEIRRTPTPDRGFVLTISDMTERARADTVLREAQKMQAIGQLTGGIAHDFNNLLTVVLGSLELAATRPQGETQKRHIERAVWAAQRGASLTKQLLAFARKQPLEPKLVDLSTLLPDIAGLLKRTLGEHIDVQVIESAGLWSVLTDTAPLESALLNLALNARDAMPGGGRLAIELANSVLDEAYARANGIAPGDYVLLALSDTGHGMTPDVAAHAFEPFFSTKTAGGGTGLGLAMVYGFVKQSGGHIKLYSESGEGTVVKIYLPRATGVAAAPQRPTVPVDIASGDATILVVEDDASVREVTVGMLEDLGYRVLQAADAEVALRAFAEHAMEVDLLLMDVLLQGKVHGREVAERITAIRPDVKVLYMSGYTANAIVHQGRLDEGVQLITKPFHRDQLARKIAQVLNAGAGLEPAAKPDRRDNVVDLSGRKRSD